MIARGDYYDGRRLEPISAEAEFAGSDTLIVRAGEAEIRAPTSRVRVTGRGFDAPQVLLLPGGTQFHTTDADWVERGLPASGLDALALRLERNLLGALLLGVLAIGVLGVGAVVGLPRVADRVARELPAELERELGERVLGLLDESAFGESETSEERRQLLTARFDVFAEASGIPGARLELRSSELGANAFAIPGGTVIFTDDLIALLEDEEQFLAIAAHELGHQAHRHALRAIVQNSILMAAVGVLAGDAGLLGLAGVALPSFLLQNAYSRGFEQEADGYALARLSERELSPAHFAKALRALRADRGVALAGWLAYASSHPPTADRIERAEAAARAYEAAR